MDIGPIQMWKAGSSYEEHDIVELGNLPYLANPGLSQEYRTVDGEVSSLDISGNSTTTVGSSFLIDDSIEYTASCMIKKDDEDADLITSGRTSIKKSPNFAGGGGPIVEADSIGVGIGIEFYNSGGGLMEPDDYRNTHRLVASSELDHNEWLSVHLHIPQESVPKGAVSATLKVLVYGHKSGNFLFTNMEARTANRFFYCTESHSDSQSLFDNNSPDYYQEAPWTQDFHWRPSYGGQAQFSAINENLKLGEGGDYVNNLAINSLPMALNVTFENRTDKESRAIIHFLQEKLFAYDSIFSINYKGERLLSSDVQSFNFVYSYPYKQSLKYTCTKFSHSISYRNKHSIQATFICNTGSSLQSVESNAGYNQRIDAILPVAIDGLTKFEKDVPITLKTFSLEPDDSIELNDDVAVTFEEAIELENLRTGTLELNPIVERISRYPEDDTLPITGGIISLSIPYDIDIGTCLYITVESPENSIFNVGLTQVTDRLAANKYYFEGIVEGGNEEEVYPPMRPIGDQARTPIESNTSSGEVLSIEDGELVPEELGYSVLKLSRCPWNCLSTSPLMPAGEESISNTFVDDDGQERKRVLFLPNYRRVQLESEITKDMTEVTITPLENFETSDSFDLIVPAIYGRSAIYIDKPNEIPKYPYLRLRNFDQRPSQTFTIDHSPDHIQSEFTKVYNKKFKRGINQNLSTFNVSFSQRSDKEAKEILQFLESHLGYRKFRFQMPRPYLSDTEYYTSLSGKSSCIFYCPSWTHVVKYKNNHSINATFIESNTFEVEDLRKNFGLLEGRTPEAPCYEAEIYDYITKYEMCTFSSILEAAISYADGRDHADDNIVINTEGKQVDMVFIIDTDNEMFSSLKYMNEAGVEESQVKIDIVLDILKKMATTYGIYVAPGTEDYGQPSVINAPNISEDVPPWPIDNATNASLAQAAFNDFHTNYPRINNYPYQFSDTYDATQTRRFRVKIGLKEVNIGIVLVDSEKPLVTLVGGGKSEITGYREVTRDVVETRTITPDPFMDECISIRLKVDGGVPPYTAAGTPGFSRTKIASRKYLYTFTLELVDKDGAVIQTRDVIDELVDSNSGSTYPIKALQSLFAINVEKLVESWLNTGATNECWFTFITSSRTKQPVPFKWDKTYVEWTNQITNETSQVKKLVKSEGWTDNHEYVLVMVFNEKGERQDLTRNVPGESIVTEVPWKKAWIDIDDPLYGYSAQMAFGLGPATLTEDAPREEQPQSPYNVKGTPSTSEFEALATEARAYALYFAETKGNLPQPYVETTTTQVTESVPQYSDTNDNDYFDKVIIYNKLEALTPEQKTDINYLNAAREALYQLYFSTRAETVTDRFIFMIGRGNPGKSAISLLNEVRENRDLARRRPNDYDLFREKIISEEKLPVRYNGRNMMPWYDQELQTRVIFAGIMGNTEGPKESAKMYAYDYFENPENPHGHLEVASDRLGRVSELGAFMDIFKTIEILCHDTGYQNLFRVTIHNCGPHTVKLLNTLVSSYEEADPIKYTTELMASGIPKGGFSNNPDTISTGESLGVPVGADSGELLVERDDMVMMADAENDDPISMIIGAMDNSFVVGDGGQFFGDPYNTNLLDSRNDRQNIIWQAFNSKYEAYRNGIPSSVDGGWDAHRSESRGVYNDGVAFKNMPIRVFRLASGLEIIDYNIGGLSEENEKRGDYKHIPEIAPGEEIDLFFGIRSANYDINDKATGGLEDIQLLFNAEDHTMNKMDFYANVMFRVFGQKIKFDFSKEEAEMYFPYGLETPEFEEEEEEDQIDPVISPVEGVWKISGATLYAGMSMTVELGPAIMEIWDDGEPLSNNDGRIIGKANFKSNVELDKFDNKSIWDTMANNEQIFSSSGSLRANLPAGRKALYESYSSPAMTAVLSPPILTEWGGHYVLKNNDLYIFGELAGTGQTDSAGNMVNKTLEYEGSHVVYNGLDGSINPVADLRTSIFQYKFTLPSPGSTESSSGSGNDWQKALGAGGHGEFYLAKKTWADPRLVGGAPQGRDIDNPQLSAAWIGDTSKSKMAKATKL